MHEVCASSTPCEPADVEPGVFFVRGASPASSCSLSTASNTSAGSHPASVQSAPSIANGPAPASSPSLSPVDWRATDVYAAGRQNSSSVNSWMRLPLAGAGGAGRDRHRRNPDRPPDTSAPLAAGAHEQEDSRAEQQESCKNWMGQVGMLLCLAHQRTKGGLQALSPLHSRAPCPVHSPAPFALSRGSSVSLTPHPCAANLPKPRPYRGRHALQRRRRRGLVFAR